MVVRRRRSGSDPGLLILVSLAGGHRHGHAIMIDIEGFAGERLGPGTLYGAIERLESERLIEPLASHDRRRPYRLTAAGAKHLDRRLRVLGRMATVGTERLAGRALPAS